MLLVRKISASKFDLDARKEKSFGKNVCKSLLKHENMTKLMFFGGSGIASSAAVTRTHTKL